MCPLPSFKQEQLVASLAASPPLPSASPTPTPGYSGADPRPQISSSVKHSAQLVESACNVGDLGLIPGLGRSPGDGNDYPLQYSSLENSMDSVVHGVAKNWTWQSDFHFQSFPGGSEDKDPACSSGDVGLIPGLRRSPGEGNDYPLQYSCLVGYSPLGCKESDTTERLTHRYFTSFSLRDRRAFGKYILVHLKNNPNSSILSTF